MDFEKLSTEDIKQIERRIAAERGRKGGQVKSERKRLAGQANIAKASARLAEIRAAKRILAGNGKLGGRPKKAE